MLEKGNILRMSVSFTLALSVLFLDCFSIQKSKTNTYRADTLNTVNTAFEEKSDTAKDTEKKEKTVTASAGEVQGKIVNKFITPYTANTSYNNVYLKNSTDLSIDIKSLLEEDLSFKIAKDSTPQVLILHTHATESFLAEDRDYYTNLDLPRSADNEKNTVMLGKIISDKLNAAGIGTVHSEVQHDNPSYNDAYSNAAKTINSYLKQYPSIKIVIDLHRDSVSAGGNDKAKLTTNISGKQAAQVMLVMGSQSGSVKNFPNWRENLKLAVKLQQTMEVMYPTLARSLSLMPKNYNESLTNGSLLLEVGTEANSLEEVKYSADLVGNALICLLNTLK